MNYKWIFKIKYNANGFVPKHKACLVTKRFTQIECIDCNETFSSIAQMESIWIVLVIVATEDFKVHQIKIAFLKKDLWKDIYMQLLEGFVVKGEENMVYKLQKSLHGLK
jgi:hypothetical protein